MPAELKYTKRKQAELATDIEEFLDKNPQVLFIHRVMRGLKGYNLNADSGYQLAQKYEIIGKAWTFMREELECRLIEKGLNRETDSSLTKFCLSANYSWKEKSEVTNIDAIDTMPEFGDE